jgi:uncharacterized protein YneF (UPF0154 family)
VRTSGQTDDAQAEQRFCSVVLEHRLAAVTDAVGVLGFAVVSVVSSEPLRRVAIGVALALVYGLVAHFFTRRRLRRVLGKAPGLSTAEQEAVLLTAGRAAATAPLWLVWIVAGS